MTRTNYGEIIGLCFVHEIAWSERRETIGNQFSHPRALHFIGERSLLIMVSGGGIVGRKRVMDPDASEIWIEQRICGGIQ